MRTINLQALLSVMTFTGISTIVIPDITMAQDSMDKKNKMEISSGMNKDEPMYRIPEKPEDISPLLIGESIPTVTLKDAKGMAFDLNRAVSSKPTILVFYRGGWCPYCTKQLSGLQELTPELEKMGYQLLAISTDSPEGLMESANEQQLGYTLLSDAGLQVSKKFGLAFKAPKGYWEMLPKTTGGMNKDLLLPVPSVFILDKAGKIHYEYINPDFKQRLSPELLKAVATTIYNEL
ncbi:Peroxiredoxin [Parapedobacter luteus]|uniref:thioredoxin-dependent peroxiredoxin n=1 Tax=Parapedobacter luteus TaxID=623280 RepID=A0A1T5BHQ2_9SPHI|nr:peroxiredoxin family protein [Parapedobacter luteus]SKB46539.1 Peroxiredoxin [Parapedobacter luteus]